MIRSSSGENGRNDKGNNDREEHYSAVASQHKLCDAVEVRIALTTWSLKSERDESSKTKEKEKLNNSLQAYFDTFSFKDDISLAVYDLHFLLVSCVAYHLFLFVKSLLTQGNVNVIDGWKKWCADEKESIEKTIGLEKHFPVEESEKTCGNNGQNYCHQKCIEQMLLDTRGSQAREAKCRNIFAAFIKSFDCVSDQRIDHQVFDVIKKEEKGKDEYEVNV